MRKKRKLKPEDFSQAVVYTRVSSKEQEVEGFSIQAQERLLRDFAASKGLKILREFQDIESAKQSGRSGFESMLRFLADRADSTLLLVEKTDRLSRNFKDGADIESLGITTVMVKENICVGPSARSAEKLTYGFRLLVSKHYIDNLSEESSKGMREKAEQGFYPSRAPVGYRNVAAENGKRTIAIDEQEAAAVKWLFEQFGTSNFSIKGLVEKARLENVRLKGRPVFNSLLHEVLRRRTYSGDFDWNGEIYRGNYPPLVSRELWNRVQAVLQGRKQTKARTETKAFLFRGFIRCGHCGCLCTGEIKKGKYIYYRCTGNRGKCGDAYTREEALNEVMLGTLADLVVPDSVLRWLDSELARRDELEHEAGLAKRRQLDQQLQKLRTRLHTLYEDRLDRRITPEQYDHYAAESLRGKELIEVQMKTLAFNQTTLGDGLRTMQIMSEACRLFPAQPMDEQRKLLSILLEGGTLKGGKFEPCLKTPFSELRRSNSENSSGWNELQGNSEQLKNWLPG